jgi:hypothetical protein
MIPIVQNKEQLFSLLLENKEGIKRFGVKELGVFGSFVRDEPNNKSDVDLLVEFDPSKKTYRNFIGLVYYLEELVGRKVEMVTSKSISPYIEPYIIKEVEYVPFSY